MRPHSRTSRGIIIVAGLPVAFFLCVASLWGQEAVTPSDTAVAGIVAPASLAPALNLRVQDTPNDAGGSITVQWDPSPDEHPQGPVRMYRVWRACDRNGRPGEFAAVGDVPARARQYSYLDGNASDDSSFFYKVQALNSVDIATGETPGAIGVTELAGPVRSSAQWFDWRRINTLVGVILLCAFIIYFIIQAKAGKALFIRKIAGLEAVDEAVGRATEMGRKIYYIPGSQDMDNVQTLAGITILGRVAELSAQYDTWLDVPVSRSLVMVTCREVVKEAYMRSGRADAYHEDQVHYLTDDQFGYAAGIDGMVVRERPATIFLMGSFYAEALILAETGNSVGAIQIAGTGQPSQLPFFVAACDYTLIGEELFAASAYLSKEPRQLGSLKGQDIGKGLILVAIVVGIILETLSIWQFHRLFTVIE